MYFLVTSFKEDVFVKQQFCLVALCVLLPQDVMNKVRSDNLLDMNLEKSRVKELVSHLKFKKHYLHVVFDLNFLPFQNQFIV